MIVYEEYLAVPKEYGYDADPNNSNVLDKDPNNSNVLDKDPNGTGEIDMDPNSANSYGEPYDDVLETQETFEEEEEEDYER